MDSLTRYAMASARSPSPSANRRSPAAIRRGVRAPAGAGRAGRQRTRRAAARSPPSTPCSPRATTSRTRSPTRRAIPRRPHRAVAQPRRPGPLPGIDIDSPSFPGHATSSKPALRRGAPFQATLLPLPALSRPDRRRAPTTPAPTRCSTRPSPYPSLGPFSSSIDESESRIGSGKLSMPSSERAP